MRSLAVLTALFLAMLVAGCGLFPEQQDETAGWSANKLYTEAKEAMNDGAYEKSILKSLNPGIPMVAMPSKRRSTSPTPTGRITNLL